MSNILGLFFCKINKNITQKVINITYLKVQLTVVCVIIKQMNKSKNSIQKIFGQNVRKYRKEAGFTQEEFSEKLGISQKHLSIIETGTQFASAALIEKISDCLKVKPASFFDEKIDVREINAITGIVTSEFQRYTSLIDMRLDRIEQLLRKK